MKLLSEQLLSSDSLSSDLRGLVIVYLVISPTLVQHRPVTDLGCKLQIQNIHAVIGFTQPTGWKRVFHLFIHSASLACMQPLHHR
jgi:hypothetical protein